MIVYGRKAPKLNSEDYLQKCIIKAISVLAPNVFVAHIPNGGSRAKQEAINLKAAGVKRGVPDLVLVLSSGQVAFIEVKTPKGKLSPEQDAFGNMCVLRGTKWACIRNIDEVKTTLEAWRELPLRSPPIAEVAA